MRRVFSAPRYEKHVAKLLSNHERADMEEAIADSPGQHPIVPGTGGARKARWTRQGSGKRGGVRVIYYYLIAPDAVYFMEIYAKNEKENLSHADKTDLKKALRGIKGE